MQTEISTHAPAGGATRAALKSRIGDVHFYSRPCGRGDQFFRIVGSIFNISTHAPAGGATHRRRNTGGRYKFLLTPLREGRPAQRSSNSLTKAFLLTPLREGRRGRKLCAGKVYHFYSRPCGRGDGRGPWAGIQPRNISTHAPAGGATDAGRAAAGAPDLISTHAPAGGATALFLNRADDGIISTHAPAGGATRRG